MRTDAQRKRERDLYALNRDKIRARKRKAYRKNAAQWCERSRKYREAKWFEVRKRRMLFNAKIRAAAAGLPFNLTLNDVEIPAVCPVLGIRLAHARGKPNDNSPTVDRLKPELGYVRGNTCVISYRANRIKNNACVAELRAIADWMEIQELV